MEEGGCEELHPRHVESEFHIAPDWERPAFDPYHEDVFTAEGMKELIGRLREAGLEIEGPIFEAFRVEDAWRKEVEVCGELFEAEQRDLDEVGALSQEDELGDWLESLEGYDEDL